MPEITALFAILVGVTAYFAITLPPFRTWNNALNILDAAATTGIIAAPVTMLMVSANLDLSVGSGLSLCAVTMGLVTSNYGPVVGILVSVLVGLVVGLVNAFFVTIIRINSLITTLGMLTLLAGVTKLLSGGKTVSLNGFSALGTSRPFANIPTPVLILLGIMLLFWFLTRYTVLGRVMYATGANSSAARLVGLRSRLSIAFVFLLIGLCVALSGLTSISELGAASQNDGVGLELEVVTAVVLGGTSLAGGRGTVQGTFIGLLIIGVLDNGLVITGVTPFWQDVARGALLIFAVSFDRLRLRVLNKEA
jgi:ribose transport system permease protein